MESTLPTDDRIKVDWQTYVDLLEIRATLRATLEQTWNTDTQKIGYLRQRMADIDIPVQP